jgi:PhnB protein
MKLTPYLNFNGNCRAAFQFYEKHLGGKITFMMTHAEAPAGQNLHPEWGSAILHAHMTIGDSQLMASDVPPEHQQPMRSAYLSLEVADAAEAERVFSALEKDGQVIMPLQETFWAFRFGMLRDQFGVLWMVNASRPAPQP